MSDFESVIRDNLQPGGGVGSEFLVRVLGLGNQVEMSIKPVLEGYEQYGEAVDFAVSGNNIEILEG